MKRLIALTVSLTLAVGLCFGLDRAGVISLGQNVRLAGSAEDPAGAQPTGPDEEKSAAKSQSDPVRQHPSDEDVHAVGNKTDTLPAHGSEAQEQDRALAFLQGYTGAVENLEDRFNTYLRTEAGLDQGEVFTVLRMSFWKDFLTLQLEWQPGQGETLAQAFAREMELKKAGFKARGLQYLEAELESAKKRLEALQQTLEKQASKGTEA